MKMVCKKEEKGPPFQTLFKKSVVYPLLKSYGAWKWDYFHVKTVRFIFDPITGKEDMKGEARGPPSLIPFKNRGDYHLHSQKLWHFKWGVGYHYGKV